MGKWIHIAPAPSVFGFGALKSLPGDLRRRNFRKILVITDPQIAGGGILDQVLDQLKADFELELFREAPAEPHSKEIDAQKDRFGTGFDALLAVGGGSAMDFAKALAILMTHGGSLADYVGEGLVPAPVTPVVCVPTTSGTGSQSTQTTVFTIGGIKMGCSSEFIRPVFSVVDPELTMGLPPEVTRNAGYDALVHAVESYAALDHHSVAERPILYQGSNPFSRGVALEAFRLIWGSYRKCVADGRDRKARADMSLGAHLAGLAFSHSGLGLVHALASSLGGMIDAPHGVCLAASTRIGLNYNLKTCEKEFSELAAAMGEKGQGSARKFIANIEDLVGELGFPRKPGDLGIKKEEARTILEKTLAQKRRLPTTPRLPDDELLSLIEEGI